MIQLLVNGEPHELPDSDTVAGLLQTLEAPEGRVAVLVNDEIVSADERPRRRLANGDRVEIITFAAGG
jgi:thiamine biosynthesis protein ThiS